MEAGYGGGESGTEIVLCAFEKRKSEKKQVQLRKVKSPRESKEREHDSQLIRSWIEKPEGEGVPPEAQEQGKEFEEDANKPGEYRTRSGRLVRPPRRWGFED